MVNPILKFPADAPLIDANLLIPVGEKLVIRTCIFDAHVTYEEGDDMYLATIQQQGKSYPGYWILTNNHRALDARRVGTFLQYSGKKHIDIMVALAPTLTEVS